MNAFIELLEYNVWANRRILNQVHNLAQEPALQASKDCFHFIRNAIFHLIKAEWVWLDQWKGEAIMESPEQWEKFEIEDFERIWIPLQTNTLEQLKSIPPHEFDHEIAFSNGDEKTHVLKFWQTINLVVNHASYYRGQISNMIDSLGIEPVKTQLFDYYTRRQHT